MESTIIKLKAKDIYKMGNKYVCYVQANSIPDSIMEWMETNPRKQAEKKRVSKIIRKSLMDNENFHELNRGIVESVSNVYYNSSNELYLTFENPKIHGNVDGAHSLKQIINVKNENLLANDRYVFMEIFEGIKNRNELAKLAKARNTSKQVSNVSIYELENRFESIKKLLKNSPFENRVAYKENQHLTTINNKEIIPIEKIIAILTMFDQDSYPILDNTTKRLSNKHPIDAYSVKTINLDKFANNENRELIIKKLQPISKDIFRLWDEIEQTFPDVFNKTGRKYGSKSYSHYKDNKCIGKSCFYGEELYYDVPHAIMFPLVGAFRSIVKIDTETELYCWTKNPLETWNKLKEELVTTIANNANIDNSNSVLGKDHSLWNSLLQTVYFYG